MKKIFFILMLPLFFKAQTDSLKKLYDRIQNLETQNINLTKDVKKSFNNIQLNLDKCHKQFILGLELEIAGFITTLAGGFIVQDTPVFGGVLIGAGVLTTLSGGIVIINSHKFIGRAGLSGLTVTF